MRHEDLVSAHFCLRELLPNGYDGSVPEEVLYNMIELADELLEPARSMVNVPIDIGSCWRPEEYNALKGGVRTSDHIDARAADCQAKAGNGRTWEQNTIALFHAVRVGLAGAFGQLILEDHRRALNNPKKLWVHMALPTPKHPGFGGDVDQVLISMAPKVYRGFEQGDYA